eukprot:109982-Pleurochrysis_carterae.AAC.1
MQPGQRKKINDDVDAVVEYLKQKLGATWSVASQPRAHQRSLIVNPARSARPWMSVAKVGRDKDLEAWIRGHLDFKITWM